MTWTPQLIRYKKLIKNENYFREIAWSIKDSLTDKQLSRLILQDKGETYNLWEQIFLRFIDNRYSLFFKKTEAFGRVEIFLEKYTFLLNSNLDDQRVRYIFMKALMEVISIGSEMFWSSRDFYFVTWGNDSWHHRFEEIENMFRLWRIFRRDFRKVCDKLGNRYPTIPTLNMYCWLWWKQSQKLIEEECTFENQLLISYAYPFRKLLKKKKINLEFFEEEFCRRTKWYLESLNQCNTIFVNKYKDGVCRELSSSLGMDVHRSYAVHYTLLRDPEATQYRNKNDLSEFISSLFTEEELKLLELKDVQGNVWSFKDQIKDRYYSKYPSFASMQAIEENIRKKVEEFRSLLNAETSEVIKDIFLDEIERECFVSQTTYLWNQEMDVNLKKQKVKCGRKVIKAIDFLMSVIPSHTLTQLSLAQDGGVVGLREQLIARWARAYFGCPFQHFKKYLSQMHFYTSYSLESWKNKETISRIDLQAFLEEIDMFFLYPRKLRIWKWLTFKLDNGRAMGLFNVQRVYFSQKCGEIFAWVIIKTGFVFLILLLIVVIILWRIAEST